MPPASPSRSADSRRPRARAPRSPSDPVREGPRLEALVENVPGNVYRRVRRPDGTYHFAYLSSGLFRHFGVDHERLLASPALRFEWVHPDDRERFVADLALSAATLSLLDHRVRVMGSDGRVHWARGIARPERLADGSVVWDGVVIDVTREVEAEAELRVTKEEAERAHRRLASTLEAVALRLRQPAEELRSFLEAGEGSPALRASLEACLEALRLIGPADPGGNASAISGTGGGGTREGAQARRVEAIGAAALTARQREVMAHLSAGRSNKEIAAKLGIAPGTARLHVAAVLRACRAKSRREFRAPAPA